MKKTRHNNIKKIEYVKEHFESNRKPMIAASVTGQTSEAILSQVREFMACSIDIIEWRADYFEKVDDPKELLLLLREIGEILSDSDKLLLFTLRTKAQGGLFKDRCFFPSCDYLDERQVCNLSLDQKNDIFMDVFGEKDMLREYSTKKASLYMRLNSVATCSGVIDLIDIEITHADTQRCIEIAHAEGVCVIGSYHDFDKTPNRDELLKIMEKLEATDADISKLAVMPKERKDVKIVLETTSLWEKIHRKPFFIISMSEMGAISRLIGEIFDEVITFAGAPASTSRALGQLTLEETKEKLDALHDFIVTKKEQGIHPIALLGSPVAHSFSKIMQNMAFENMGLPYRYYAIDTCEIANGDLSSILFCLDSLGFCGYALTKPCKVDVLEELDEKHESVKKTGACNTIVMRSGGENNKNDKNDKIEKNVRMVGYNTDGIGAVRAFEEEHNICLANKTYLVLGAGGTAKAVCTELAKRGAKKFYICSKSHSCEALAEKLESEFPNLETVSIICNNTIQSDIEKYTGRLKGIEERDESDNNYYETKSNESETHFVEKTNTVNKKTSELLIEATLDSDIILNLTGVGMYPTPDESPISKSFLREHLSQDKICFDATYNPKETGFLKVAREMGCQVINGEKMLIYQAIEQIRLWTGVEVPATLLACSFRQTP